MKCSYELLIYKGRTLHHPRKCSRNSTVERDGKLYCGQHDPEAVAWWREKRTRAWIAKQHAENKANALRQLAIDEFDNLETAAGACYRFHGSAEGLAEVFDHLGSVLDRLAAKRRAIEEAKP